MDPNDPLNKRPEFQRLKSQAEIDEEEKRASRLVTFVLLLSILISLIGLTIVTVSVIVKVLS